MRRETISMAIGVVFTTVGNLLTKEPDMKTRREQLDRFSNDLAEHQIANLRAQREDNELDFHRERADVPDCDGVGVHLHRPHDDKVGSYRVAAVAGVVLGTAVAFKLTELSVRGSRVTVSQIVDPTAPQLVPAASEGASTLPLALVIFMVVLAIGKIVEAAFNGVERRRFLENADRWFRNILLFGSTPAAVIVLARLATGDLTHLFIVLEGPAWAGLELALVAVGALGWVGSTRFAWSRRYHRMDKRIQEQINSLLHKVRQPRSENDAVDAVTENDSAVSDAPAIA